MKIKISSVMLVGVMAFWFCSQAGASAWDELNDEQKKAVDQGRGVLITQEVQGSAWPRATFYQAVHSTPEEAVAVFFDYELQKSYIPGIKKAKIAKTVGPAVHEVEYVIELFGPFTSQYTMRDSLAQYDGGQSFRIEWQFVKGDNMKAAEGNIRFEPHGTSTLMVYKNFVVPTSPLAGTFKEKAIRQMKETGISIVNQIQKEKSENQALLQKQLQALREALK